MDITGTKKRDSIKLTTEDDTVRARDGNDIIVDADFDFVSDDFIFAGAGNDKILSWGGRDQIFGGLGNDFIGLVTFEEGTSVSGGQGRDVLHVSWVEGAHDMTLLNIVGIEEIVYLH